MTKEEVVNKAIEIEFGLGNVRSIREHNSSLVKIAEHVYDLLHPSLPSELDEAAEEYAKTTFKKPHSDNPDEEVTIVEPDKYAGFIAGAKWDKEQIMSNAVEGTVYGNGVYTWVAGDIPSQFKYGDKVRIIIVKE